IQALPPKHQQVVYLRFYVNHSLEEIAAALGCSVGTVKSRLFRALDKLRTMNVLHAHLVHSENPTGRLCSLAQNIERKLPCSPSMLWTPQRRRIYELTWKAARGAARIGRKCRQCLPNCRLRDHPPDWRPPNVSTSGWSGPCKKRAGVR